jgi:aspartate aminotransferase
LGFLAAPLWLAKACNKLQGQFTSGPCNIAQKAAEEAYRGDQAPVQEMGKAFARRRNLVMELLKDIPELECNVPEGAFYIFPRCSSVFGKTAPDGTRIGGSLDLAMYLLNEAHVAGVAGVDFGNDAHIRLSYATGEETLREAFRRIKESLARLS